MTGDEEAFVVWFISAHPAKKQPIISTTIIHFALFTRFLPDSIDEFAKSLFGRHPGEPRIMSGAGAGVQNILN
jgi:hypothetical protein